MATADKPLLLTWSEQYSVGVRQLDEQHRYLFELVQDLYFSFETKKDRKTVGRVLGDLYAYAVTHTTEEEELMEAHGFPELAQHRAGHRELRHKLRDFIQRYEQGDTAFGLSLFVWLQQWIHRHLLEEDRKYIEFFREKGVC